MKALTIQGFARAVGVKISVANAYIKSLEAKGIVKSTEAIADTEFIKS